MIHYNKVMNRSSERGKEMKKDDKEEKNGISLPLPSSSALRGRQSVRATFKLSEKAIGTISIVATHLGIKQKSLFDHLIDDARSLNVIAGEIESERYSGLRRIQKTYVLSRKTLSCLEETSRNFDAPRDALVVYSIQRLLPVIEEERAKHQKRKEILREIKKFLKQGEKILRKASKLLGKDDPVFHKFKIAMKVCYSAHNSIESFVDKGRIIEDF